MCLKKGQIRIESILQSKVPDIALSQKTRERLTSRIAFDSHKNVKIITPLTENDTYIQ